MADKKSKILLVEDDSGLGFVIQDTLKYEGYTVHLCRDGKEGLLQFNKESYDLCLLDVMLPKKDGFSLAEDIRRINTEVPIVFLTAKSMVEDKVKGFQAGGDDYITKPFDDREFLLRIEAILKRSGKSNGREAETSNFQLGMYAFDPVNFSLEAENFKKVLTKKEAGILKILCENPGKVIERNLITNLVWGDDNYFVGRSLDVFITKLRKYLAEDERIKIVNVHGVGFKLEIN